MTGSIKRSKSLVVGVAGGSGSGKTFFTQALRKKLGASSCTIISQDNFYRDQSGKFDFDGGAVNFDHPDSIDFDLLTNLLARLKRGECVDIPVYDFVTHTRTLEKIRIEPTPVIVVDGILIFHPPALRAQLDKRIYFQTPEDLRFKRRLERDVKERGRTPQGVHDQFYKQVKPMHDLYVEPTIAHAHTVVNENGDFDDAVEECCRSLIED